MAEVMALFRAVETARPRDDRLFDDPFAEAFLGPSGRALARLARLSIARRLIVRVIDRKWPGARTSAIARTRLVDDALRRAVAEGATQIVLLGAGFDSRAYRLPELSGTRVFEVDQPATQNRKTRLMPRHTSATVVHIPLDFNKETLDTALCGAGFDRQPRSFVVWEGVTNYLTEAAVDATLRALSAVVARSSTILFTYVDRGLLDGSIQFEGGARVLARVREAGERWTMGFDPRALPEYLAARGLTLVEDLSADDYRARYFGSRARAMRGYSFYRAAIARFEPSPRAGAS
jgi:methyltransferase (TIGR00027 family)